MLSPVSLFAALPLAPPQLPEYSPNSSACDTSKISLALWQILDNQHLSSHDFSPGAVTVKLMGLKWVIRGSAERKLLDPHSSCCDLQRRWFIHTLKDVCDISLREQACSSSISPGDLTFLGEEGAFLCFTPFCYMLESSGAVYQCKGTPSNPQ